jgi:hypothetical protein
MGSRWKRSLRIVLEIFRNGRRPRQGQAPSPWWKWSLAVLGLLVALARACCGELPIDDDHPMITGVMEADDATGQSQSRHFANEAE